MLHFTKTDSEAVCVHELLIVLFDTSPQSKKHELANYSLLDFLCELPIPFLMPFFLFNTAGNFFLNIRKLIKLYNQKNKKLQYIFA